MEETVLKGFLAKKLYPHIGHKLECVAYGDLADPLDICIECIDCNEVLVSAAAFEEEESF